MNGITRKISLDLSRKSNVRISFATETDMNSRNFLISLYDGGVFYKVEKSVTAAINVLRPDGQSAAFLADVTDDGHISYTAGLWVFSVSGEVKLSVSLYLGDEKKITSNQFSIDVAPALYLGEDIDKESEDYSLLGELMNEIADIKTVEEARVLAEKNRDANELTRTNNESKRNTAEAARVEAEGLRAEAEAERSDAEAARALAEDARAEAEAERDTAEAAREAAESGRALAESERGAYVGEVDAALDELLGIQEDILDGKVEEVVAVAYPIGAIYLSVSDTAPAAIFGGTWERLKDRFLLGAGDSVAVGSEGGSSGVMLTKDNLPGTAVVELTNSHWADVSVVGVQEGNVTVSAEYGTVWKTLESQNQLSQSYGSFVQQSVATVPPYIAVHMWKRIA